MARKESATLSALSDNNSEEKTLTILSWNVNGFWRKKSTVLDHLRLLCADMVFLQETHIGPSRDKPLGNMSIHEDLNKDYNWALFNVYRANSRGVGILFRRDLCVEGFTVSGDAKGRYMVISCTIRGEEFVFVNVYNPTDEKIDFAGTKDFSLKPPKSGYLIIGGDFNTVLDAELDKTSTVKNRGHKDRLNALRDFMEHFKLVDVWRCLYPDTRSFTYFDGPRKGKSRLDYFFVPAEVLSKVRACMIHERPQHSDMEDYISDHAPISIEIQMGNYRCQLDQSLFEDQTSVAHLSDMIRTFTGGRMKRKADLWPGLKVRLGFEARTCKRKRMEREQKESALCTANVDHHDMGEPIKCVQVLHKKQLEIAGPTLTYQPEAPSRPTSNTSVILHYLDKLHNDMRFEEHQVTLSDVLMEKISKREILLAIFSLADFRGPSPDGLPIRFYQHFSWQLTDYLRKFFNQVLDLKLVCSTFNELFMTKPFYEHDYCNREQNYSPIAMFNIDYKILATILAERLSSVMEHVLNPGRHGHGQNVDRGIYAVENLKVTETPALVLRLKVDPGTVKFTYLSHRLRCYNLPGRFRSVLLSLLTTGRSSRLGCDSSHPKPQPRGLKVGCPLTPVLVHLCLHPLIQSIDGDERLQGVELKNGKVLKALVDSDIVLILLPNQIDAVEVFEEKLSDFLTNSGLVADNRYSEVLSVGPAGPLLCSERLKQFRRVT